jgi:uncharacterized protein YjiS (DUF1127 family)
VSFPPLLRLPRQDYLSVVAIKGSPKKEKKMGIRQTFKKWAAYQQTVRELAALDNRQLNDLGISRADIQKIARDHARTI